VSGPNFDEQEFAVVPSKNEGMSVEVFKVEQSGQDKFLTIRGFGGPVSQIVVIEIFSSDSELIQSLNNVFTTKEGSFLVVWKVPKDTLPGIITIKASYHADSAENTFELK
ncbi:MAG TPA: biofilm-associated protein, partial [Nitrosopumilaceae archaeon]|nr:biofilm-associated protein [Nitrosopumilaceae archaeon]